MSDRVLQYRRVHNTLLLQKQLALREGSSPFTLVLDTVEQSAKGLIRRCILNAKIGKAAVIFVSFETQLRPPDVSAFITTRRKNFSTIVKEIQAATASGDTKRFLLVIDTIQHILSDPSLNIPAFFASLIQPPPQQSSIPPSSTHPNISILAVQHTDIALPSSLQHIKSYSPNPTIVVQYLATTILTVHSPPQLHAKKIAAKRSLPEPSFGLDEDREGILIGMTPPIATAAEAGRSGFQGNQIKPVDKGDVIVEAEFRRRSGRAVREWFYVPSMPKAVPLLKERHVKPAAVLMDNKDVILLDDHPLFSAVSGGGEEGDAGAEESQKKTGNQDEKGQVSTFDLTLTAKQRRDREGVVLPYFDAQNLSGGPGEGGRIVYEMGVEDDFDEEEDEI